MAASEALLTPCCCFENDSLRSVPLRLDCHLYVLNFYVVTENKSWSFDLNFFSMRFLALNLLFYLNFNYLHLYQNFPHICIQLIKG